MILRIRNINTQFQKMNILNKLIYINLLLFLTFGLLDVISFVLGLNIKTPLNKLALPSNIDTLIQQPWSFISYMFLHNGFLHLLFNLIWLHFSGKLFLQYLNSKQLLSTYILGGISGGILFIISYNYIPNLQHIASEGSAIGASASVFAIMIAASTYAPNYSIQFPFIGRVKLKHIAIFMVILDILSIPKGNAGGHIAHIGGAIFGYIYIKQMKKGKDLTIDFTSIIRIFINMFNKKKKPKFSKRPKSDYEFNAEKAEKQKEIDRILEKIAKSGYESLSKTEKKELFSASKK